MPIELPDEWTPARLEVCLPIEERHEVGLTRNGVPIPTVLQTIDGRERITAEWPRSGAGRYWLAVHSAAGIGEQRVTILPRKISREAFRRLLDDLERRLPAAVAVGLQRAGALAGVKLLPPREATRAQELQRLRFAVLGTPTRIGVAVVLTALAHDPHHMLQVTERWVRAEDARRPHAVRLVRAIAQGCNLDAASRPERVVDVRVQHTVDVYENRIVRLFQVIVERRLRRFWRSLERDAANTYAVDEGAAAPLRSEVRELVRTLSRAQHEAGFLADVTIPTSPPDRTTMVLVRRPAYRAAYEGYLDFVRNAWVNLDDPALDAPLENLPYLYQLWCTLELLEAVLQVAAELGYRVRHQRLIGPDRDGYFVRVLRDGRPALELQHPEHNTRVTFTPERTYSPGAHGLNSLSFAQRPDIALEVHSPTGPPRVYLFDPKYKLDSEFLADGDANRDGQPKKVDVDKMHTYRDAIRSGDGTSVVCYAAILYPGPRLSYPTGLAPAVEALQAYPGSIPGLAIQVREVLLEGLSRDSSSPPRTSARSQDPASTERIGGP